MNDLIEIDFQTASYNTPQAIDTMCAAIEFINAGTANLVLDSLILLPAQSISYNGNLGEIIKKQKNISFTGAGTKLVFVVRKYYVNVNLQS